MANFVVRRQVYLPEGWTVTVERRRDRRLLVLRSSGNLFEQRLEITSDETEYLTARLVELASVAWDKRAAQIPANALAGLITTHNVDGDVRPAALVAEEQGW